MTTSNTPIYASQARPWLKFYDQKYIDQTMPACTAFELVCRQNKNRLGETALEYYGRKFTYADFIVNVKKTAAALRAAGLKKGDIATVVSVMTPEIIFAFYAADMIGATLNLVDPRYSVEGIREYIEEVDSHLLICLNVVYERCHQAAKRTHVEHVVVLSPADSLPLPLALGYKIKNLDKNKYHSNVIHWKQFLAAGKDESIAAEPYDPEHACVVVHTGGTTGSPKGVMLTHSALCAQVGISSSIFPVQPDDVFLSVLPLSHTYECSIGMIYPFSMGAQVVYLDRPPTASALMPALRAVRPSVMLIVPLIIEKIYRLQVLAKFKSTGFWRTLYKIGFMRRYLHRVAGKKLLKLFGGRLRFLGIGGAKLDGDAEKFLLEAKVPYAIGYGLTETAPLLAGAAPSQVRLGSTGPQAPGVELRLENINPDTRQGEIVAHSPSVMLGYFKNPEATKEVFTADGWFRTGDLGEFDKDGWLYIKGRLKNMIVGPGGENIYPEDIETVLNSHVYIADSIVTEQQGRLVALVHFNRDEIESMIDDWREEWTSKKEALEAKTEQLKKEILDFVNAKVNRFSRISEVVEEKDDFVKTPTHKIKRFLYSKKKESGTPGEHPAGRPETK